MDKPFETDGSKKIRTIDLVNEDRTYSGFSYFMDGSRRTYKIGDMVLENKKIYPVVVAQIRAGCTERDRQKKLHTHGSVRKKNLLLCPHMLSHPLYSPPAYTEISKGGMICMRKQKRRSGGQGGTDNGCNSEFGQTLYNFGIYYAVMQRGKEYARRKNPETFPK